MKRIDPRLETGMLLIGAAILSGAGWLFGRFHEPLQLGLASVLSVVGIRHLLLWRKGKDVKNSK